MLDVQRVLIRDSKGKTVADFGLEEKWQKQLVINFLCSFYLMGGTSLSEGLLDLNASPASKGLVESRGSRSSEEAETSDEFVVTASNQTGKREVIRWGRTGVTGNLMATMQALYNLHHVGGEYDEPKDLFPYLENNARYELEVAPNSLRNQLRWLKGRGLVTDDNQLVPVAEEMVKSVEVIERPGTEELPEGFWDTEKVEGTD